MGYTASSGKHCAARQDGALMSEKTRTPRQRSHVSCVPPRGDIIIAADLLIIPRAELQSIDFFLSHAQMDSESLQVDFEWACNLE
jgi:hypothetical protein